MMVATSVATKGCLNCPQSYRTQAKLIDSRDIYNECSYRILRCPDLHLT